MKSYNTKIILIYLAIILLIVFISKNINVNLNLIFALLLSVIAIKYYNYYINNKEQKILEEKENKLNSITPKPINRDEKAIDFLYYIRDFYEYNPPAFEEVVDSLDNFYKIKEIIKHNNQEVHQLYDIAEDIKINALNSLHSMIFKTPVDKNVEDKLSQSLKELEELLNNELEFMYKIYKDDIYKNGRRNRTKEINIGPKPFNNSPNTSFNFYN